MASLVSYIVGMLLAAYITHTAVTFYQLFNPKQCENSKVNCFNPYMERNPRLQLVVIGSTLKSLNKVTSSKMKQTSQLIWLLTPFDVNNVTESSSNISLPVSVARNGSYYLHALLLPQSVAVGSSEEIENGKLFQQSVAFVTASVTVYKVKDSETYHLIQGATAREQTQDGGGNTTDSTATAEGNKRGDKQQEKPMPITHWYTEVTLCVMSDNITIPRNEIPMELYHMLSIDQSRGLTQYRPMLYVDTFLSQSKHAISVNASSKELPLTVKYNPISVGKLRLRILLQQAMENMKGLGFGEKDTDEMKGLLADTNLYLLLLTFVVSIFHLLFDFLAFKNDVQFWRSRKSMVGISSRTVVWRCVSQIIILLYLYDQESVSLLVTIPNTVATVIEMWKVGRALKVSVSWSRRLSILFLPSIKFGDKSDQEDQTEEFDSQAMKYLSYVLYPLCISGAMYSLIYVPHKSWYSWCVSCLVNGVYAFGFLFMLPQLFLNYKLKSVAHLPWRAFMYKAFNTFIDDVFAFIITMPTAHRLACFRDDIIFLIYLYQRWLYPVDKKRANEFGQTFDNEDEARKEDGPSAHKKPKQE